jgi:tRNA G18 (ribose-2'-O)-methylase SpoU
MDERRSYETLGLEFLLYGVQSPVNIGMILRVAEVYQFKVSILDLHGVLKDRQKLDSLEDFACGAISRRGLHRLDDPAMVRRLRSGRRLIATSIGPDAVPLPQFPFAMGDLVVLGNEYDGLPDDILAGADARLHIPSPPAWLPKERSHSPIDPSRTAPVNRDGQPSLNVAMTAGVVCYAAYASWLAQQRTPSEPRA